MIFSPTRLAGDKIDYSGQIKGSKHGGREGNLIKLGKARTETSEVNTKLVRGNKNDGVEAIPPENPRVLLGKRSFEGSTKVAGTVTEASRGESVFWRKHPESRLNMYGESNDISNTPSVSHSLPKDSKPSLKLKFKNPSFENQSSWGLAAEDEKSAVKGQRSKRKRPSPLMEKTSPKEDEDGSQFHQDDSMNQIMDANWILKKLGKDAIGKRVEVHQSSDNCW